MKKLVRHAILAGAAALAPLPLLAQSAGTDADTAQEAPFGEFLEMFAGLYDTGDLEPVDPARLELAAVTAQKLIPDGAYAEVMGSMMDDMLSPLFGGDNAFGDMQIMFATGVDSEAITALDDNEKAQILDLLDPYRAQRSEALRNAFVPGLTNAIAKMEPPLREGISRAYARRFSIDDLTAINDFLTTAINDFLTTDIGERFARETLAVYADPEVMQASMQAMPEMLGSMFGDGEGLQAEMDALPQERQLKDLSSDEMTQLADLLDVDIETLEQHNELQTATVGEQDFSQADGERDDTASWSDADRAQVEQLEAEADEALERYYEAYERAAANASADMN